MDIAAKSCRIYRKKSLPEQFVAADADDRILLSAKNVFFSTGRRFEITDATGERLGKIQRCFSLILPKYRVSLADGDFIVQQKFSLRPVYTVKELGWTVEADHTGWDFLGSDQDGRELFRLKRQPGNWTQEHHLQLSQNARLLPCFCLCVAIFMAMSDIKRK